MTRNHRDSYEWVLQSNTNDIWTRGRKLIERSDSRDYEYGELQQIELIRYRI